MNGIMSLFSSNLTHFSFFPNNSEKNYFHSFFFKTQKRKLKNLLTLISIWDTVTQITKLQIDRWPSWQIFQTIAVAACRNPIVRCYRQIHTDGIDVGAVIQRRATVRLVTIVHWVSAANVCRVHCYGGFGGVWVAVKIRRLLGCQLNVVSEQVVLRRNSVCALGLPAVANGCKFSVD